MRDAVASLLDDEAVPIALEFAIKLLLDFARNVTEVRNVMIFKRAQSSYHRVLYFVIRHVRALNQHAFVRLRAKRLQRVRIVAGDHRNLSAVSLSDSEGLESRRRYFYHF